MPHPNRLPPLSDAQLEIMNVVWDRGEASVADVWRFSRRGARWPATPSRP